MKREIRSRRKNISRRKALGINEKRPSWTFPHSSLPNTQVIVMLDSSYLLKRF